MAARRSCDWHVARRAQQCTAPGRRGPGRILHARMSWVRYSRTGTRSFESFGQLVIRSAGILHRSSAHSTAAPEGQATTCGRGRCAAAWQMRKESRDVRRGVARAAGQGGPGFSPPSKGPPRVAEGGVQGEPVRARGQCEPGLRQSPGVCWGEWWCFEGPPGLSRARPPRRRGNRRPPVTKSGGWH